MWSRQQARSLPRAARETVERCHRGKGDRQANPRRRRRSRAKILPLFSATPYYALSMPIPGYVLVAAAAAVLRSWSFDHTYVLGYLLPWMSCVDE
jgi:hypothetical protein